jgi:hypothetical protein
MVRIHADHDAWTTISALDRREVETEFMDVRIDREQTVAVLHRCLEVNRFLHHVSARDGEHKCDAVLSGPADGA